MWAVAQRARAEVHLIRGALRMGSSDIRSGAGDAGDAGDVLPHERLIGPVFPFHHQQHPQRD